MTKYFSFIAFTFLTISCNQNAQKEVQKVNHNENSEKRFYSKSVTDSFSVFISLPNDYNIQHRDRYPVVYLLDANLYFDIIAVTINKYSEVGLSPSVILVGIGYKDFPTMDSLRNRDYTYPVAIPEYEMGISGGADNFLSFINNELVPYIDKEYKTDTLKRVLVGHSLGGYFSTYALLQNLIGKNNTFSSYVAASPSIHYNNYYLLNRFKDAPQLQNGNRKIKAYIAYGGLEEDENASDTSMIKLSEVSAQLFKLLSEKQSSHIIYKSDIFSNLGHMDTQIPTFLKGLQWTLNEDN